MGVGAGFFTYLLSDIEWIRSLFLKEPKDIEKIRSLCTEYRIYFNRLQNIFDKYYTDAINDNKAQSLFTELFENNAHNQTEISIAFGTIDKKMNDIAAKKSDDLLTKIYYGDKK